MIREEYKKTPAGEIDWEKILILVRDHPHILGHMCGKDKLTELHSDWVWLVWGDEPGVHTALQAHRGGYKTTILTEIGCIWWLLFHPNDRIAIVRETWSVANETLKTIASFFELEVIQALFKFAHGEVPKFKTKKDGKIVMSFKKTITKEGSIDSYGITNVKTGTHYDRILCDDIITINDRFSKATRESVKEGVKEIMTNIIDPGKTCMFVGTPWHRDDAWEMKNGDGDTIIPTPHKYDVTTTNILSEEDIARKKATTTKSLWAANYDLVHMADEGQLFQDPIYGEWDYNLHKSLYSSHLDAKYDGDCMNALTVMARRPDGKIQAYGKCWEEHIETEGKLDWMFNFLTKLKATRLYNETNPDKGFLAKLLRKPRKGKKLRVKSYHESLNKHRKIVAYLRHYWEDIIWHEDTDPEYMAMILDYREGEKPDDAPDSAASLLVQHFYPPDKEAKNDPLYDFD